MAFANHECFSDRLIKIIASSEPAENSALHQFRHRIQPTTDGHRAYFKAVEESFPGDIDYTMLVKQYGEPSKSPEAHYSTADCIGIKKELRPGNPNKALSARPTSSGRTSPCGCICGATRA